ncbi:hypothetical protein I7I48_02557 [Histoplasma ohiense]|nr:hypothetical protein I7I48_02557 [Histoplasma ohiense (nom. inval.)]
MMVSAGLCHPGPNHYVSFASWSRPLSHLFITPFQSLNRPLNAQPHGFQFCSVFCLGCSSSFRFRLLAISLLGTRRHIASGGGRHVMQSMICVILSFFIFQAEQ